MKKIFVLTGAGISKESGIPTFRDSKDGLWHNHKIEDVASLSGWSKDPQMVLDFYNERRSSLKAVEPNEAHKLLAKLQNDFDIRIFTQNVDDLHERAGSNHVYHLHGCLTQAKSERDWEMNDDNFMNIGYESINLGDKHPHDNGQLRPNVVFFGEFIHYELEAEDFIRDADYVIVIGSSLVVYPVARFPLFRRDDVPLWIINTEEIQFKERFQYKQPTHFIMKSATNGMKELYNELVDRKD